MALGRNGQLLALLLALESRERKKVGAQGSTQGRPTST